MEIVERYMELKQLKSGYAACGYRSMSEMAEAELEALIELYAELEDLSLKEAKFELEAYSA